MPDTNMNYQDRLEDALKQMAKHLGRRKTINREEFISILKRRKINVTIDEYTPWISDESKRQENILRREINNILEGTEDA